MPEDPSPAAPEKQPTPEGASAPGNPLALPRPRPRLLLWITLGIIVATIAGSLIYHHYQWKQWEAEWNRLGPIDASGGVYFPARVALPVPPFRQGDDRWRKDKLGNTKDTVGGVGCAVTSATMVMAYYGADIDPGRMNKALTENDGYEGVGWLKWEKAAEVCDNIATKIYEAEPSYRLIDEQLQRGNPVIVRLHGKSSPTHFVVIAGKDGYDYLTLDPGAGSAKGLYPLKEYGSKIEALRFYEPNKKVAQGK